MRNTVKVGDDVVDVGMVLRQDGNGQLYYDHMIHDMKGIENAPWASPAAVNPLSPKGTRGSHPALHGASAERIDSAGDRVNMFILGVRSLRGITQGKDSHPEQ